MSIPKFPNINTIKKKCIDDFSECGEVMTYCSKQPGLNKQCTDFYKNIGNICANDENGDRLNSAIEKQCTRIITKICPSKAHDNNTLKQICKTVVGQTFINTNKKTLVNNIAEELIAVNHMTENINELADVTNLVVKKLKDCTTTNNNLLSTGCDISKKYAKIVSGKVTFTKNNDCIKIITENSSDKKCGITDNDGNINYSVCDRNLYCNNGSCSKEKSNNDDKNNCKECKLCNDITENNCFYKVNFGDAVKQTGGRNQKQIKMDNSEYIYSEENQQDENQQDDLQDSEFNFKPTIITKSKKFVEQPDSENNSDDDSDINTKTNQQYLFVDANGILLKMNNKRVICEKITASKACDTVGQMCSNNDLLNICKSGTFCTVDGECVSKKSLITNKLKKLKNLDHKIIENKFVKEYQSLGKYTRNNECSKHLKTNCYIAPQLNDAPQVSNKKNNS